MTARGIARDRRQRRTATRPQGRLDVTLRNPTLAIALLLGGSTGALAQIAGAGPAPAVAGSDGNQIQDIVVTAQRRSENLQNVPISVTALSADRLQAANVQSTASLQAVTPAITFSDVNGFLEPSIRGVGSRSAGASVENSIATYVDGVYIASAPGSLLDLNSVERVEVLKGPQGTLFGRNATGGLIQVITRDPKFTLGGSGSLGYGSYNTSRFDGYLTGPLTRDVAADVAIGLGHQADGYGRNFTTSNPTDRTDLSFAARTKLLWNAGPTTTVHLSADYSQLNTSDPTIAAQSGAPNTNNRDALGNPIILFHAPHDTYANVDADHFLLTGGGSLRVDQKIGGYTLSSLTAYRRTKFYQQFDADAGPKPAVGEIFIQHDGQFSQELQLTSPQHGSFTWIAGVYYYDLKSAFDPFTLFLGVPNPMQSTSVLRNHLENESIAGYAQGTLELGASTNLTAGIRYTDERRSQRASTTVTSAAGAQTVTSVPYESFRSDTPTWRVSLDHKFGPDALGYASWNRGFKSGGYNSSVPTAPNYLPERLDAYELGAKTTLFDRRLRLNAAGYYYDYNNIQVNTYLGSLGVIYNGAKAEVYGVDLDFDLIVAEGLRLSGGTNVNHARFTNFPAAQIGRYTAAGTIAVAPGSATGNHLPYAPDATFNLGLDYKHPLFGGEVEFFANDLYNSGFFSQADNLLHQGSYHLLNASVTWRPDGARYFVKAYVNNALNEDIYEYLAVANGGQSVSYQAPRTFGATVGVKF